MSSTVWLMAVPLAKNFKKILKLQKRIGISISATFEPSDFFQKGQIMAHVIFKPISVRMPEYQISIDDRDFNDCTLHSIVGWLVEVCCKS